MKRWKSFFIAAISVFMMAKMLMPASVYASQSGTEVAVIIKYINKETGEEVLIGLRDQESNALRETQPILIEDSDSDSYERLDIENRASASFQINDGDKEPTNWSTTGSRNFKDEDDTTYLLPFIRGGHYYMEQETSDWTADTVITVSDVEIPEGYTEVSESGVYTATFGQSNYEKIQSILNGEIEDYGEAIYIYIPVYISDGSKPAEDANVTDNMENNSEQAEINMDVQDPGNSFASMLLPAGAAVVVILLLFFLYKHKKVKE